MCEYHAFSTMQRDTFEEVVLARKFDAHLIQREIGHQATK